MATQQDSLDTQTVVVWINQAAGFAKRDNFYEAAGRMRFAAEQVGAALAAAETAEEKAQWAALHGQVQRLQATYAEQYAAWNSKIAAGRQGRTDAAAEEMSRPLPIPADK